MQRGRQSQKPALIRNGWKPRQYILFLLASLKRLKGTMAQGEEGFTQYRPLPPKYRIEHMMYFEKWWGRVEGPKTFIGWWSLYNKRIVDETKKLAKKTAKK